MELGVEAVPREGRGLEALHSICTTGSLKCPLTLLKWVGNLQKASSVKCTGLCPTVGNAPGWSKMFLSNKHPSSLQIICGGHFTRLGPEASVALLVLPKAEWKQLQLI